MKKISFAAPTEVAIEVDGVKLKVVSLPKIEIRRIYAAEQRLARQIAKKELDSEKEELLATPFDAQAWAANWCEVNYPDIGIASGLYSTFYAKHNSGQKPPQSLYEVRLQDMTVERGTYGTYHYFIRNEDGSLFFNPEKDFENGTYSIERDVLTEWFTTNLELNELVRNASLSNLLGFISPKPIAIEV